MRILFLAIALLFSTSQVFAAESELSLRQDIANNASELFVTRQFAKLNALERQYRGGERTPGGVWKLTIFYTMGLDFSPLGNVDFEKSWPGISAIVKEWISKNPSPAAYIVLANAYMDHGWYLSEAAQDDKKLYHAQTLLARQLLEDHKAESDGDPEWYATMARVAAAQQWPADDVRTLYAKAIKASPQYYETYYQILGALLPYWDDPGMATFQFAGQASLDTHGQDPELYARILWHAMQQGWAPYGWPVNLNWPQIKASMIDLVSRYPDQWNINNMGHIACRSLDKDLTAVLTDQAATRMDDVWDDKLVSYDLCQKWSHGSAPSPFLAQH